MDVIRGVLKRLQTVLAIYRTSERSIQSTLLFNLLCCPWLVFFTRMLQSHSHTLVGESKKTASKGEAQQIPAQDALLLSRERG